MVQKTMAVVLLRQHPSAPGGQVATSKSSEMGPNVAQLAGAHSTLLLPGIGMVHRHILSE